MSNEELKPCPFCGAGAMSHTEPARVVIGCFSAKCAVNPSLNATTTKRASELWNKRVSDRLEQENAELREALKESRSAISACSIQESRKDGTENRMKIKALDKLLESIDNLLNK